MNQNLFCPNLRFRNKVINILNQFLFNTGTMKSLPGAFPNFFSLSGIYSEMKKNLNCPGLYNLYHADGTCLKVINLGNIYYGHDIPIWLNDPKKADYRLMIVGEVPRRSSNEMYENTYSTPQLSISSPFGVHSTYWRRGMNGIVPQVLQEIIEDGKKKCNKTISVYLTDACKLYNTSSKKTIPLPFIYPCILCQEIKEFKPNIIIALGNNANNHLCKISPSYRIIKVKHPSRKTGLTKIKFKKELLNILESEICKNVKV